MNSFRGVLYKLLIIHEGKNLPDVGSSHDLEAWLQWVLNQKRLPFIDALLSRFVQKSKGGIISSKCNCDFNCVEDNVSRRFLNLF